MKPKNLLMLLAAAASLLGLGFTLPSLVIYPAAGEYTYLMKVITPHYGDPREVSIASGIFNLLSGDGVALGIILLIFSVFFPLAKLGVLWSAVEHYRKDTIEPGLLHVVEKLGRYSMLDILVLALVVMVVKKMPGGTQVTIGPGVAAFTASIIISMVVPALLRKAGERREPREEGRASL